MSGAEPFRLRPMSVGDVLDATFTMLRAHWWTYAVAMACVSVPLTILRVVEILVVALDGGISQWAARPFVAGESSAGLTVWLDMPAWAIQGSVATVLAGEAICGRSPEVAAAFRLVFRRLLALLWATSLALGAIVVSCATLIGIPLGLYLFAGWLVGHQTILIEGASGRASLGRSARLIGGHRWRALGLYCCVTLIQFVLGGGGLWFWLYYQVMPGWPKLTVDLVNLLVQLASGTLLGAVTSICTTILYFELRVRKEALDLELLAGESSGSVAAR